MNCAINKQLAKLFRKPQSHKSHKKSVTFFTNMHLLQNNAHGKYYSSVFLKVVLDAVQQFQENGRGKIPVAYLRIPNKVTFKFQIF